jgi:hypothetical protein
MRKQKTVRIERGHLTGTGSTKTEARADLEKQIDWALREQINHVEVRNSMLIMIVSEPSGFSTAVRPVADLTERANINFSSLHGQTDYLKVRQAARLHAVQMAWTPESDDGALIGNAGLDAESEREFRRWIKFQQDYAKARANGMNDADAHRTAIGL